MGTTTVTRGDESLTVANPTPAALAALARLGYEAAEPEKKPTRTKRTADK